MSERRRVDQVLVERGLMETRARARAAIEAGLVTVGGRVVTKPSELVDPDAALMAEPPFPWVSRGGVKLAHALDAFQIDPRGRVCIDIGASTGGFTDVLLARGARHVTAVDVGTGQFHPRLAADPRVTLLEQTDARTLTPARLAEAPSLLVCDVSFISVLKAVTPVLRCLDIGADLVVLVKPQFEVGPARVGKGGIVAPADAAAALEDVRAAFASIPGVNVQGTADSPIAGGDGNREFLLHAVWRGAPGESR